MDTVIKNILATIVAEDLVQEKSRDDHAEPRIVDVGIVQGEQKEVAVQEGRNMDGKVADVCNVVALEAIPLKPMMRDQACPYQALHFLILKNCFDRYRTAMD